MKIKTINLLTHSGQFHADDILSTALLNIYFKNKEPKTKLKYKRSIKKEDIEKADIVYDIGGVYDIKKLRFDHHQNSPDLVRSNGVPYAAFGLVFKHFGKDLIGLISGDNNKKNISEIFEIIEKNIVQYIDAMDNGMLAYNKLIENVNVFTLDYYFSLTKNLIDLNNPKEIDKKFFELVKLSETVLKDVILYSIHKQKEKSLAIKMYKKAKDKRVIVCDRFYDFNFNIFPEPLLIIYPDLRGNWSAKNVQIGDDLYNSRFYFPESWRGLVDSELEKFSEIKGAKFCHKSGFLCVNTTKDGLLKMIHKAFNILKVK